MSSRTKTNYGTCSADKVLEGRSMRRMAVLANRIKAEMERMS